jgi:hypothetical protein
MNEKELLKWLFENKPMFRIGDRVWFIKDGEPQSDIITGVIIKFESPKFDFTVPHYVYFLNNGGENLKLFSSEDTLRDYLNYKFDKLHESKLI